MTSAHDGDRPAEDRLIRTAWEHLERVLPPVVSLRLRRGDRPLTLRECVPVFLRWLVAVRGRSHLTAIYYAESLRAFIEFCEAFKQDAPRDVTEATIETYLAKLTAGGRKPATVNRALAALRSFCKYLLREQILDRDPAATSYGPRVTRPLPVYLTVPEWTRLLRKLRADPTLLGQRDHAIIATFLYCGLRVAELALVRVDQVRLEAGWLRVRGKGSKERDVPIPEALAPILRHYLAVVRPRLIATPEHPYVFVANEQGWETWAGHRMRRLRPPGTPLLTRTLHRIVRMRIAAILGRVISPHKLRHSYASRLRQAGGDLQLVQELLGHADLGTTMIYSHLATEARKNDVDRLLGRARWGVPETARQDGRRRRADAVVGPHVAVGDRLRAARQRGRLTIRDLAAKAKTGRATVLRAERGASLPRAGTLRRIAEALGVSMDWILTGRLSDPTE
jgi:site-specific recombinase XerD/DNA-binding XRE family transcriptional regulator